MAIAPTSGRPFKLTIAALGGQGGGVLADWLVMIAEAEGHLVQATSVPGVAQRTGATLYYLEFFPRRAAHESAGEPIMALMPVPGDVDCVLASELAEAGRAIQRGLVTPGLTTLICSTHRAYSIAEKSALGDGAVDSRGLLEAARAASRRCIAFDMEAMANSYHSVISSVLLGALAGSGVLPFRRESFEAAIRGSGIAVDTNLAAFAAAARAAAQSDAAGTAPGGAVEEGVPGARARLPEHIPARAQQPAMQPLLDRVHALPAPLRPLALASVRRLIDYQDPAYAALYLQRLERLVALEPGATRGGALSEAAARALALWMSFEDVPRVADLKTRRARHERIREEVRPGTGQIVGITDFVKPRVAELAGSLPAALGRRLLASGTLSRALSRWLPGRRIRSGTLHGFLLLYGLAGLKRWRRGTLRYREENARIEGWLGDLTRLAVANYALATELARAPRLVKGYGETHERGWRHFSQLLGALPALERCADGPERLSQLCEAALADEEGRALAAALARLAPAP